MSIYFQVLWIFILRKVFMLAPMALRIRLLRGIGVKIGRNCIVHTPYFSTEPYLIEIGDHVAISAGTEFITHDASGFVFADAGLNHGLYGTIKIGNNVLFGLNCTVLPNTTIGSNCVIGAGSVVRGVIPDDSVVFGNPAEVVMKTPLLEKLIRFSRGRLDTRAMKPAQKRRALLGHFGLDRDRGQAPGAPR